MTRLELAHSYFLELFKAGIAKPTPPTEAEGQQWAVIAFKTADGFINYDAAHPFQPCVMPPATPPVTP